MAKKGNSKMHDLMRFGKTWWGKQWIESMLSYGRYFRMHRGINYANENRVSNVLIKKGEIFGQCQGTAPAPYRIRLNFEPLENEQWNQIIKTLSKKAIYEAVLISGEMPKDIDRIFTDAGIPLFPPPQENLNASCTCPDKEIPCKHIAAIILTLAKIFDYDPFQLIKLRGMNREEILNAIELENYGRSITNENESDYQKNKNEEEQIQINSSLKSADSFLYPEINEDIEISFQILEQLDYGNIIDRIDAPSEIDNKNDFIESIRQIYETATKYASNLILKTNNKNGLKKSSKHNK